MLKGRHFLKLLDFSKQEIEHLLSVSSTLKSAKYSGTEEQYLLGKNVALLFEKTSTRTRCAFEVACYDQGAHVTYLGPGSSQLGDKETVKDTSRVLSRMYDGIQYRGFGQEIVEELAKYSSCSVWNGLTDEWHPTQILGDLLTMREHTSKPLEEVKFVYVGDARFNMGNSLLVGAAKMGMKFVSIAPKEYQPSVDLLNQCMEIGKETGAEIVVTDDINQVKGADFVHTDVWVSMGEPADVWKERIELFIPYQVNKQLMEMTENDDVKFMHCLPAFHNSETKVGAEIFDNYGIPEMEVSEEVFESPNSIVWDQAENRLHTIKAIMVETIE